MKSQLIIEDGFYPNPDRVRAAALNRKFSVVGNYPGYRTQGIASPELKIFLQRIVGRPIKGWVMRPEDYNGAYQYTTSSMNSWVHRDRTDWAGIVYLTPDAPLSGGTGFYRHKETGICEIPAGTGPQIRKLLDRDSSDMTKWDLIDQVGNVYNRLVLFRGRRSHRSMDYFGTDMHTGRLTQLFFFNTESRACVQIPRLEPDRIMAPKEWEPPAERPKVTMLIFTTSRYDYLEQMLHTFYKNVDTSQVALHTLLIDDYPQRRDEERLMQLIRMYGVDQWIFNDENIGYAKSWERAWKTVHADTDYIWHQEEDFCYDEPVDMLDLIAAFEESPIELTQLVLKRQVWFESNDWVKDVNEGRGGTEVEYGDRRMIISQRMFNANPCLYKRWVIEEDYPFAPQETIGAILKERYPERYSAFYGGRLDAPRCMHIGDVTRGIRHDEKDPAHQKFKHFDPNKEYESRSGRLLPSGGES